MYVLPPYYLASMRKYDVWQLIMKTKNISYYRPIGEAKYLMKYQNCLCKTWNTTSISLLETAMGQPTRPTQPSNLIDNIDKKIAIHVYITAVETIITIWLRTALWLQAKVRERGQRCGLGSTTALSVTHSAAEAVMRLAVLYKWILPYSLP